MDTKNNTKELLKNDDNLDQILDIIGDNDFLFHQALEHVVNNNRFDQYQKLLCLDFPIYYTVLAEIILADPKYFDYYLEIKGYHEENILKSLNHGLTGLKGPWVTRLFHKVLNAIENMRKINIEWKNVTSLIEIDQCLMIEGNYSIENKIISFIDQYQFEFDHDFASILSRSRLSLVDTMLGKYYNLNYNILIQAVEIYNFDMVKYLISNYPTMDIDLSIIINTKPYGFCYLKNFEKYYVMLKLLDDHGVRITCVESNEISISFIKLVRCLKNIENLNLL